MKIRSYFHKREKNVLRMWTGRAETMTAKEGLKWCWQNMLEIRFFQFFLVMRKYLITTKCSTSIEKNPIHPRFWTVKISKFHIDQNIPLYIIIYHSGILIIRSCIKPTNTAFKFVVNVTNILVVYIWSRE